MRRRINNAPALDIRQRNNLRRRSQRLYEAKAMKMFFPRSRFETFESSYQLLYYVCKTHFPCNSFPLLLTGLTAPTAG